jgi:DNA-binding Lrp family transcriptional regulator
MAATKAFVLIETAVGKTKDVVGALRNVGGVTSVDVVTGPYDIIAVVEADDLASVGETVTGNVHTVGGIVRTVTCLAVGSPG